MSEQDYDYNRTQKLDDFLAAVEIDRDGNITINGNLLIKGHIKVTENVIAFCHTPIPDTKCGEKLSILNSLQSENESLRHDNQRLQIETHRHRGD